jgi:hypothetical protein
VLYDIKWIGSGSFEIRKKRRKTTIPPKHTWYVKCNKRITTLHFVQYDVLWSTEKQYWPRLLALVNIAFQCSITHHIAFNEVQ